MKELVEVIAKSLVDYPDQVVVTETENEKAIVLELRVAQSDMGKVIGKQGRIAKAIRSVVKAAASKENKKVKNSVLIDLFYEDGLRTGERSGEKKGIQKGMQEKEIALIVKKVRRGKNLQTIADELEEPVDEVRKIYEAVMKAAPDYDIKMIRESLA